MELENQSTLLEDKREELIKIREELKKAKENATQSWLDSRPLIDELEQLNKNLEIAKIKNFEPETLVSNLEAELEATKSSIKSKKEEELSSAKAIEELNQALEKLSKETETLKRCCDTERQKKLRLKHVFRVKRLKLHSLQLRIVAAETEIEASKESKKEALRCVSFDETEVIRLSHKEYEDLKKRAKDKNALVNQRISDLEMEKVEAEKSLDFAMAKWSELKKKKRFKREIDEDNVGVAEEKIEVEELGDENKMIEVFAPKEINVEDQLPPTLNEIYSQRPKLTRRAKTLRNNKKSKKKKKMSFFFRMRQCFVLNVIKRLFS